MRALISRGLGGAALVVLVALAWMQWRSDRADAPGTLLELAPHRIDRIVLEIPGQRPQTYRRHDGHWWHLGRKPRQADADARLDRMASIAAAPVQRWLPLKGMDLRKLGLKPPRMILVLNGRRLEYGVMTPFAPGRYVRVGGRIAVIPAQYTPRAAPVERVTLPGSP